MNAEIKNVGSALNFACGTEYKIAIGELVETLRGKMMDKKKEAEYLKGIYLNAKDYTGLCKSQWEDAVDCASKCVYESGQPPCDEAEDCQVPSLSRLEEQVRKLCLDKVNHIALFPIFRKLRLPCLKNDTRQRKQMKKIV